MKRSKQKEAAVLLIDVGNNVGLEDHDGQSFLGQSKVCASKIIQRKIFSNSTDEFSLTLVGSKKSKNELDYPNINVVNTYFTLPNWNLLKKIEELSVEETSADWLDGLIVAINQLKSESECKEFTTLKIIFMSNFGSKVRSQSQIENVIDTLKDLNIQLVVIGPQIDNDNDSEENQSKSKTQRKGEIIIKRIVDETEGVLCQFEEAMALLDKCVTVQSNAAPWHHNLQIGENIFIPLTAYKKIAPPPPLKWKRRKIDKAPVVEEKVFFQGDKEVAKSDVIQSYLFGQTVVPFSVDDKVATTLSTEKCCQLLGFTAKKHVPLHMLLGDSVHYVVPKHGDKAAKTAVTALVKALLKLDMAAVVRKVHRKNCAPRLGVLMPTRENNSYFFYYATLPFAEDKMIKSHNQKPSQRNKKTSSLSFLPSLDHIKISQEELAAMDTFLDTVDLLQYEEDGEPCYQLVNPLTEHINNMIVFKALNPDSPLPTEPSTSVKNLVRMKAAICENIYNASQNLKRFFPLEEVEQRTYRRGAADVFERNSNSNMRVDDATAQNLGDCMAGFVQSTVTEVGTINPENNFIKLLELGEPFEKICEQMKTAIGKLFLSSNSAIGIQKPISALALLRKHCVMKDPLQFNQFIASLKDDFSERGQSEIWDVIAQEKMGLVTIEENKQSNVSVEEAEAFYLIKKTETEKDLNYEMEAEDMLDML